MIAQATRTRPGAALQHARSPPVPPAGRLAKPMHMHRLTGRMPGGKQASGGELQDGDKPAYGAARLSSKPNKPTWTLSAR